MTTADTPYRRGSAAARGWRTFRRWRRGRPFWGGLITILSGLVYFVSGHLTLGGVKIVFGPQEFLGWVIPLMLLLCGVLMLVTPAQRIFYGVLAAAISVGGLIGLNFGGFVLGMVLGMVGGALGASWAPVTLPPVAPMSWPPAGDGDTPAGDGDPDGGHDPAGHDPAGHDPAGYDPAGYDERAYWAPEPATAEWPLAVPAEDAGAADTGTAEHGGAEHGGQEPGAAGRGPRGGPLPRRSPRGFAVMLLVMTTLAVGLAVARAQSPAAAAPACAGAAVAAAGKKPATAKPAAAKPASGQVQAAVPTPTGTGTGEPVGPVGGLITTVVDSISRVLGLEEATDPSATPSASTSPTPSTSPTASPTASPTPATPTATATASAPGATPTAPAPTGSPSANCAAAPLIAPGDQLVVNQNPSEQLTASLTQVWLTFDGVTELPTVSGTIRVLEFSMESSTSTPFELRVPVTGGNVLSYRSSQLTVRGHVRFYTTKFQGTVPILGTVTYTPESPPPPLLMPPGVPLPALAFSDATLQLVLVRADQLTAPSLAISYLP